MDEDLRTTPFYFGVPKKLTENLIYRETIWELAEADLDFRNRVWIACCRDILFFTNTFLWVFEPRDAAIYPFLTWPFQDRILYLMQESIGKSDFGMEKSRDMGATWMFLSVFFYNWLTKRRQTFGLVSRTEDAVDKKDDPDCLFWKLDFHYEQLPSWMQPEIVRSRLSLKNLSNNSVFTGYSATGDVARGGRKTAFGMDEMGAWSPDASYAAWASAQHVTNSRFVPSTPQGMAGVFAEVMKNPNAAMVKVSCHWSDHPMKQRGLYTSIGGHLKIIDTDYKFPPDYPFILDGKLRSPYYDEECRRHPIPHLIAQELDIDYGGSGHPFFSAASVESHIDRYGCTPFLRGEIDFDPTTHEPRWRECSEGRVMLWMHLTIDKEPPHNVDFVIGCDVATGTGGDQATNSVASIVNRQTGEKIGEFAANTLFPDKFADYVVALRKFFYGPGGDAFVIWEMNGPGLQFGKHFMHVSPHRVYYRQNEKAAFGRPTGNPGWYSQKAEKRMLLGEYGKAIERSQFINHSIPALQECLHYIHFPDGSVDHDRAKVSLDPTAAGENHGDRVIADALCWRAIGEVTPAEKVEPREIPRDTMAWRFAQAEKEMQTADDSWL